MTNRFLHASVRAKLVLDGSSGAYGTSRVQVRCVRPLAQSWLSILMTGAGP